MKLTRTNIYKYSLVFLFLNSMFSGFVGANTIWNLLTIPLFILVICLNSRKKHVSEIDNIVLLSLILVLFIFSALISNNQSALMSNFRSCLYSLCTIGICYIINDTDSEYISRFITRRIGIFNILLIINIIIAAIQSTGNGFLIRQSWLMENGYYEDHVTGLFGKNSTNHLGVYSIFIMLLNLYYSRKYLEGIKKRMMIVFTIICQGVMAILSQYNDNIGFYLLLAIFVSIYALCVLKNNKSLQRKVVQGIKYVLLILLSLFLLFNLPGIGDYAKSVLTYRYKVIFQYNNMGGAAGSSERLAIVEYAFSKTSTWLFGTGVGSQEWFGDAFGFHSFGINSIGVYILLGGIWFYILYTLLYAKLFTQLILDKTPKHYLIKFAVLIITIIFGFYTSIYNDTRMVFLVAMIAICVKNLIWSSREESGRYTNG